MTEDTVSRGGEDRKLLERRSILTTAGLGTVAAGLAVVVPGVASAATRSSKMVTADSTTNAGAGMYASPNTVMQMSSFTINPFGVTCGVGTIAAHLSDVADMLPATLPIPPLHHSGAFAMHMASLNVTSYEVDSAVGTVVARGRMRSITQAGDVTLEDVEHNYHAIAIDGRGETPSFFATSFKTPFWGPSNPMATKSKFVDGFVMFGGHLIIGDITVA